jgi:hypothetical protein
VSVCPNRSECSLLSAPRVEGASVLDDDPRGHFEVLLASQVGVAERDTVVDLLSRCRRLRGWLTAIEVECTQRTDELAAHGRSEDSGSVLGEDGRRSNHDAAAARRRAQVCDLLVGCREALADGSITVGHVDVLASATGNLSADQRLVFARSTERLLRRARDSGVDGYRRWVRTIAHQAVNTLVREQAEQAAAMAAAVSDAVDAGATTGPGAASDSGSECSGGAGGSGGRAPFVPDAAVLEYLAQCDQSRFRSWVDRDTGMCNTLVSLDPVRGAMLRSALDAYMRRLQREPGNAGIAWNQLEVQAFINAVTAGVTPTSASNTAATRTGVSGNGVSGNGVSGNGVVAGSPSGPNGMPSTVGEIVDAIVAASHTVEPAEVCASVLDAQLRVPEIAVLVDWHTLTNGAHEHGICETSDGIPLPVDTVRRLCCQAEILPVVLNGAGQVLDQGRTARTVNRKQRRALRAMHRTCGHPTCQVRFDQCAIHHVVWWRNGGATDIHNLLPLCSTHHHLVHEGGWTLTMTHDRIATWVRPDHTVWHTGTTITRAPDGIRPPDAHDQERNPATGALDGNRPRGPHDRERDHVTLSA